MSVLLKKDLIYVFQISQQKTTVLSEMKLFDLYKYILIKLEIIQLFV